jgi:hypothetical protein
VLVEYMTHWAGWPDENDSWSPGPGNIPPQFIRDYNLVCDPYRNDPVEKIPVESLLSIGNDEPRGKLTKKRKHNAEGEITSHIKNNTDGQQVNNKAKAIEDLSDDNFPLV